MAGIEVLFRHPWKEITHIAHSVGLGIHRHWKSLSLTVAALGGAMYATYHLVRPYTPDAQGKETTKVSDPFKPANPDSGVVIVPATSTATVTNSPTPTETRIPPTITPIPDRIVRMPVIADQFLDIKPGPSPVLLPDMTWQNIREIVGDRLLATSPVAPFDINKKPVRMEMMRMWYKEGPPPNPKVGKPRALKFIFYLSEGTKIHSATQGTVKSIETLRDQVINENILTTLLLDHPTSGRVIRYDIHGKLEDDPVLSKLTPNTTIKQGQHIAIAGSNRLPHWAQYDLGMTISALPGEDIFNTSQGLLYSWPLAFPGKEVQ